MWSRTFTPLPLPLHSSFCSRSSFLDELARNRLLRRLITRESLYQAYSCAVQCVWVHPPKEMRFHQFHVSYHMKTGPSRQRALHPSVPDEMCFQVCDTSYYHTQWQIQEGPGPPLFFDQPEDRRTEFFFLEIALPHPYLRVWMTCTPLPPPLSQGLDLASTLRYHHSPLVRIARIGHFTVTDGNDTGVDLVLRQPFLLSYLNHVVLMLTSIFFQV